MSQTQPWFELINGSVIGKENSPEGILLSIIYTPWVGPDKGKTTAMVLESDSQTLKNLAENILKTLNLTNS